MLIIGTGGLAKDVIASMEQDLNSLVPDVYFFNNVDTENKLFDSYPIYKSFDEVQEHFNYLGKEFIVCIGNPIMRKRVTEKIESIGGEMTHFISQKTCAISPLTKIKTGVVVQQGCIISRNVALGKAVFINASVVIGHDVKIGEYVSIGPGVRILGHAEIGEFSYIGTNAVIMPGVKIGKKVRIGVGKIITEDVPDNSKII
jgi:sugar O-acyltransferase (sialic acid O-acetyltransferase NeuD family)